MGRNSLLRVHRFGECRHLRGAKGNSLGRVMALFLVLVGLLANAEAAEQDAKTRLVRIAGDGLQVALDVATGSVRELIGRPAGFNQLTAAPAPVGLWQITVDQAGTLRELSAEQAGVPRVERFAAETPSLRLVWDKVDAGAETPLTVAAVVCLDRSDGRLSRWTLTVTRPAGILLKDVRFPRVGALRARPDEALALPRQLGTLNRDPRALLRGKTGKGSRFAFRSPSGNDMNLPCLAWYQQDGPGFIAACDDPEGFRKDFVLSCDRDGQVAFELVHELESQAREMAEFRLPFTALLGAFEGDWTTAAEIYRQTPTAKAIAERGRLRRGLTPDWVSKTGLWLWNRGRSQQVLDPAVVMRKHLQTPVAILWHWWHNCPYDAGFPEYLPPRQGTESFKTAMAAAQREDVHAILYMNQRLWGMQTESWAREGAEFYATKQRDGTIRPEVYNVFMKAPCVPMCIATRYWREKYAGLSEEVFCGLGADGVYMDQTGVWAECHDPRHGHILGPGRYWYAGLSALAGEIRDRCSKRGHVTLGGEYPGEPWMGEVDVSLVLSVSADRMGSSLAWEPIPFFPAVYHGSTVLFGSMAGLAQPPYDEKWPQDLCPPGRLALLDRKFGRQFCLDHARSFAWGLQPMVANFLPEHIEQCPEELDYVTRMVRTRMGALKYLLYGTWLRPPRLDVPDEEIDVLKVGTYTPPVESRRVCPMALAGAWRADDGDVGIAVATILDRPVKLRLPIDVKAYGLKPGCAVYRIDETGRTRVGALAGSEFPIELPPRGVCVLEFCPKDKE